MGPILVIQGVPQVSGTAIRMIKQNVPGGLIFKALKPRKLETLDIGYCLKTGDIEIKILEIGPKMGDINFLKLGYWDIGPPTAGPYF